MVKFVLGPSGSGKTIWLIERANKEKREGNGNIVFIDTDDSHIFSLDHNVRLINASVFNVKNSDNLYGFLAGIISRDYDIEKIYIDGIYEIIDFDEENFVELVNNLEKLSKEAKFSRSSNILIDGVDIIVDENSFTTQTFIDSSYFNIDGDPDMFRLNRDDYVKI